MLITRQNRLLPMLSGVVVLMLLLVLMRACSDEHEAPSTLDTRVPMPTRPRIRSKPLQPTLRP